MTAGARRYAQWCREHFDELVTDESDPVEDIEPVEEAPLQTAADGDVG
jgi:hypothetical protein